jgi:hypothetical protein
MNIFNKYKSHIIASISTILICSSFILALFIKTGNDSLLNNTDLDNDKELALEFKLMEEMPQLPAEKSIKTTEAVKGTQTKVTAQISDDLDKSDPDDLEESVPSAKNDSLLIAEMKKVLQQLNTPLPEDTLQKQQAEIDQKKETEQIHQNFTQSVRTTNEDMKFYYENYRMILSLKRVYPYVLRTKQVVDDLNAKLATMTNNQEKRKLIKKTETELFQQFEKDVRSMSYSQGKLLVKLISRETNQTAYGLIKTYKGGIPATFWYTVGLLFHEDLKARYDSVGEDKSLEKVVQRYKKGSFK